MMNRKIGQMKILIIFLILSAIGYCCAIPEKADDSDIVTYHIEILPEITDLRLSDLGVVDISYIPLETKENSLFSCTNNLIASGKVIIGDGFYLVKCANDIIIFKNSGLFENRIGKAGRGPDEYQVAHDVQVDQKKQEIYLLAGWQQKFFIYSLGGELIRTFQIPFFCNEFIFVEDGILCYSINHMGNIEDSYNLIDSNGIILICFANKYPFQNHDAYGIQGENLFYQFND